VQVVDLEAMDCQVIPDLNINKPFAGLPGEVGVRGIDAKNGRPGVPGKISH
jgi:hypothetical protein